MAAWENVPMKTVLLQKHPGADGPIEVFKYTYKSLERREAEARARRRLLGERPKENPLDWKAVA